MQHLPVGTVTLLFTDIEGSTRLLQQLGERYTDILADCRHLLRNAFQQWNGHEVDTQGDAFFVAFARATDAVAAAVESQRALASHPWTDGVTVRVRMGLHTGEPHLASEGYVGLDVHRAARIMSAGHGGQVLLSQTTRELVVQALPDGVTLFDLGAHRLKDLQQPCQLFQLAITGLLTDFPPLKTLDSYPNNLPLQPTPFIGREKEVVALQRKLLRQDVRLVTLTGPGGVGKTRLALQAAAEVSEHFVDGTWFVSLAPISDPDLVIPTIAQMLDVRETGERSLLDQLKASLREKQVLLLLDNFEQVASAATQIADLLGTCPHLNVLVTSREALHVRAEQEFPVPALALPDPKHLPDLAMLSQYEAVAIFIERTQAVQPDFQVTNATAPAVAEICVRLDGLPLAIELAAARIKLFPPQALLTRLEQRLPLLTSNVRDAPARQQTLRKTIQWSYDLLSTQEQVLFRRLSVFVGGCTWQAIEAVSATFGDDTALVFETVASLIDKNLLRQTVIEGEELRLMMLETIHEYGQECLAASREMDTTREAHAAYYLALAEEATEGFKGPQQADWLERLEREHDNVRATLSWMLGPAQAGPGIEKALRLVVALHAFWDVRGHYREALSYLEQALARSEGVTASVRASALKSAGHCAHAQCDLDRSEAWFRECLILFRQQEDTRGVASTLQGLGWVAMANNIATARSLFEESLALYREIGDKEAIAWSLVSLAQAVSAQGEYRRGHILIEESLAMYMEMSNKLGIADCRHLEAMLLFWTRGDQATIRARLEEGLAISRELGIKSGMGGMASNAYISGWIAFSQGDTVTALLLEEQSFALSEEAGDRWGAIAPIIALGRIKAYQGDFAAALAYHEESLTRARELNNYWFIADNLEGMAGVVAAQGERVWAAHLWGAAESLRERCGVPLTPFERVGYAPAVAAARKQLGAEAFEEAWAEGRNMTLEEVLVMASPTTKAPAK